MVGKGAVAAAVVLVAVALAGCAGEGEPTAGAAPGSDATRLQAGKGAISGLLVDDAFRPLHLVEGAPEVEYQARGFILLQETGQQTRSNADGEFTFTNLEPGAYTIRVTAGGHEATPQRVSVEAGVFVEQTVIARRVVNLGGTIITQEYSAFVPCSVRFLVNGIVLDCLADASGDSYRANYVTDFRQYEDMPSFLITEMRANQPAGYRIQIRNDESTPWIRYATATEYRTDYIRIVNEFGVQNTQHNFYGDNQPWDNTLRFNTILFPLGDLEEEAHAMGYCCGLGARVGIKAQFLQTLFLGPPEADIDAYCVLCL